MEASHPESGRRAVTISYFCYGYVAWIFFSWFYRYLAKVRGLDLKSSAFYSMLPFLAMLVCCLIGGTINDRFTKWRRTAAGPMWSRSIFHAGGRDFIAFGSQVQGVGWRVWCSLAARVLCIYPKVRSGR